MPILCRSGYGRSCARAVLRPDVGRRCRFQKGSHGNGTGAIRRLGSKHIRRLAYGRRGSARLYAKRDPKYLKAERGEVMPRITTNDGTQIFYKDWGTGQPIVFSHGWPLTADEWDGQMMFFGQRGFRVIAHDRRGHGRSTQTWDGKDMNPDAGDLAALTKERDLNNAIPVGHSTGGGEVARYIGRHGSKRVAMA